MNKAIFVKKRDQGGYDIWQGSLRENNPPPTTNSELYHGVCARLEDALVRGHDVAAGKLPVVYLPPAKPKSLVYSDERLLQMALGALEYHQMQTRPIARTSATIAELQERLKAGQ